MPLPADPFRRGVEQSRRGAQRRWSELWKLPLPYHKAAILYSPRHRNWGFAELLCRKSVEEANRFPPGALYVAYLACLVPFALQEVPLAWIEPPRLNQLAAFTFAHLGNALRVTGNLLQAEQCFDFAEESWQEGATAPDSLGYRARILDLKASLLRARRRVPESLSVLTEVIAYYQERDPHLAARAMVLRAKALQDLGDYQESLRHLRRAAGLLDSERDPHLARAHLHNLLVCLATTGKTREARERLPELRQAYKRDRRSIDALRVDWIEARILEAEGRRAEARRFLERVREAFERRGLAYELAVVSLELATLAAEDGDAQEVRRLAREILPILRSQEIHREAVAAIGLFHGAACDGRATPQVVRRVFDYLRRSRGNPDLRFEPPALRPLLRPLPLSGS